MVDDVYSELTEFMDKCLYQESAPSMEEAISQYSMNGAEMVEKLLAEVDLILKSDIDEKELMKYIERHSDYIVSDSPLDTLYLIRDVLIEDLKKLN